MNLNAEGIESATTLLRILAKNTTKIKTFTFDGFYSCNDEPLVNISTCIIKSQKQLKKFSLGGLQFSGKFHGIILALESQKNSLQELVLDHCSYGAEFEILNNCKNIETLRIRCCDAKLLKILNFTISTLEIVDFSLDTLTIVQILEKSGSLLQKLILHSDEILEETLLIKTLKSFCPNITYLKITKIEFSTQLLELIGNLQKLQFLTLWTLWCINGTPEEDIKIRVIQFAKILPLTLQYLDLSDNFLRPYIDIFLNHCNISLNKLLIYGLDGNTTKALIEFCIRNKSLNYIGLDQYWYLYNNFKNEDLDQSLCLDDNIRKEMEKYVKLVPYDEIEDVSDAGYVLKRCSVGIMSVRSCFYNDFIIRE
ncbi:hypothetical protein F8M41_013357 [Gigaspora margarita]|uniref:RNI-like protein n=1 Tax=Gigaspora margarita TaxID=4874 RepID=A0A8H3WWV3_GIGMA|nr:hypothetical protein F8M41_013357 [Gigaspora margarita]